MPFLHTIDDHAEHLFSEPYPGLCSDVAQRYNSDEGYKRYRDLEAGDKRKFGLCLSEHFKGEREYSFFVSASESEEQAVFFAGTSWKDNAFGLVVRFNRDHDYEIYSPTDYYHPYQEALVASRVEPREVDKVFVVGCRAPNHMLIEYIYKRGEDGRVRKFRNPEHMQYTYLRNVVWTPESFFTPPIESTKRKENSEG